MEPNSPLTVLKGIGAKKAEKYAALGINNISELVNYLPLGYKDRGRLRSVCECVRGERVLTEAKFLSAKKTRYIGKNKTKTVLEFDDSGCGFLCVYYNFPFVAANLVVGQLYRLYGVVSEEGKSKAIINPQIEKCGQEHYLKEGIYPIYAQKTGSKISAKELSGCIQRALEHYEEPTDMPFSCLLSAGASSKAESLRLIHFPQSEADTMEGAKYFALERFLVFRCGMANKAVRSKGRRFDVSCLSEFLSALPFSLTAAQKKALGEITADFTGGSKMNRLLQGDVGSGKTAVAAAAAFIAAKNGVQAAVCAPTVVLARQHMEKYSAMYEALGLSCVMLSSALPAKEKKEALEKIRSGQADIIFGTHALFSAEVQYSRLGFVAIDEQQRYGVAQRAMLEEKGDGVHVLVMSATPIPRTLALSLYRDLDISVIDEMPAGRKNITTYVITPQSEGKLISLIKAKASEGLKTYVVCPAIDEADMQNVEETYGELKSALSPVKAVKLTGQMKPDAAAAVMQAFYGGEASVIVSTTVIEVGVDEPKAVIMWIKGAERFGLSQLHQLRGRVGRGEYESYCFLEPSPGTQKVPERLKIIRETQNGFEIAEKDLALRGSGEMLGMRQSGRADALIEDMLRFEALFLKSEQLYSELCASAEQKDKRYLEKLRSKAAETYGGLAMN